MLRPDMLRVTSQRCLTNQIAIAVSAPPKEEASKDPEDFPGAVSVADHPQALAQTQASLLKKPLEQLKILCHTNLTTILMTSPYQPP